MIQINKCKAIEQIFDKNIDNKINISYGGSYRKEKLYGKARKGLKTYLDEKETKRMKDEEVSRWEERKEWEQKIGRTIYSLTMYVKVKRITIQIAENVILLLSTDIESEHEKILLRILDLKKEIKDSS